MINKMDYLEFIKDNYKRKFGSLDNFEENYDLYLNLPAFKANENIHEIFTDYSKGAPALIDFESEYIKDDTLKPEVHWIMRSSVQYYINKALEAMKVDMTDPNIAVNALGKGTAGRIAKMWVGNDPEDTSELGSGRWNKEPALSRFPNNDNIRSTITKSVDIVACCSHHFLPFSSFDGGKVTISYKPDKYVIGISKLQRFVNWASRRFWLQEDLTSYIGKTISRIAETEDVYVKMEGIVHGCEKFRGASSKNGSLDTEYKSGLFCNY